LNRQNSPNSSNSLNSLNILVIGGGAAGMLAAGTAAEQGATVTLIEKNAKLGRKLYITGKGRCNVCNHCDTETVLQHVPVNPRFLYSALHAFSPADVMAFFEALGVPLKTERGNRVFPVSDRAADVIDALFAWIKRQRVTLVHAEVSEIETTGGQNGQGSQITGVHTRDGRHYAADRVIVATGGLSYPQTGSTGDGYRFAQAAGHTIISPKPSLVPLVVPGGCANQMGLSLRNVRLTVFEDNRAIWSDFGELLFTHFGLSGPLILSASAHMRHFGSCGYHIELDLKPALDEHTLDQRLLNDFQLYRNSDFINALGKLLPRKLIPAVVQASQINPRAKVNGITREQRHALLHTIKHFLLVVSGTRPIEEAIITTGGVAVKEVSPQTMESKTLPGLYFAGEVLDVDGYTGGFNLQIAWSTGRLAGLSAAQEANFT